MTGPPEDPQYPGETIPAADGSPMTFGEIQPGWQEDLNGLLVLGYLTGTFEWLGHKIVIKTLRTDEELIVASLVKEYNDTIGAAKAYATALCALAVVAIDGQPMPSPLGETGSNLQWAVERFSYAQRWYPMTIDAIYEHYLRLEIRVREVMVNLGKASGPEGATPGSSASSGPQTGEAFSGEPRSP